MLSPVKSWVLPLCSILIDVWSVFISELTFWLQSSQALCLKSLKFGMRIFYNCTDLSHISIVLTISGYYFFAMTQIPVRENSENSSSINNLLILYKNSLSCQWMGSVDDIMRKKMHYFPVFKSRKKDAPSCVSWKILSVTQKFPLESFLFALIKYLPLLSVQQLGLNLVFLLLHLSLLFNICTCICMHIYIPKTYLI